MQRMWHAPCPTSNVRWEGSHRNFVHPRVAKPVTISSKLGDDAKAYQIKAVRRAIKGIRDMKDSARYVKIVDEAIDLYKQDGKPLPPPTAGQDLANRLVSAV